MKNKKFFGFGLTFLIIGVSLFILAMVNFFTSMNRFEMPSLFFLFYIGMPLVFVGIVFIILSYSKKILNYTKGQIKDIFSEKEEKKCPNCNSDILDSDLFCPHCGFKLKVKCENCGTINDSKNHFCAHCGKELE